MLLGEGNLGIHYSSPSIFLSIKIQDKRLGWENFTKIGKGRSRLYRDTRLPFHGEIALVISSLTSPHWKREGKNENDYLQKS